MFYWWGSRRLSPDRSAARPHPLLLSAQPEQAGDGEYGGDEAVADAVVRPHRGVGEPVRLQDAEGADGQDPAELDPEHHAREAGVADRRLADRVPPERVGDGREGRERVGDRRLAGVG